ncbi:hypothetical protein F5Y18DRAFT_415255 [Xylariaceae sp. FL1019]|nr:hypothetical protein F5Y18DRAFT_415255 [Xylariaceae sp. FL1019]
MPAPSAARAPGPKPASSLKRLSKSDAVLTPDTLPLEQENAPDAFESEPVEDELEIPRASVDMDMIPIELVSMTDKQVTPTSSRCFIDSLSAKVHPVPPNIDSLSSRFQSFYITAAQHIQVHIAALGTRQTREASQNAQLSSRPSAASLLRAKAVSIGSKDKGKAAQAKDSDQQMLTADELADRKRARRALEQKRMLLEEAVERRLCEGIYDRIYRHKSTQDEAQDDKLRSKTAALALVGIGPEDLGVDLGELDDNDPEALAKKNQEIKEYLEQARKDLVTMSEKRYPLGKLNYLKAAHKSIVDTLSHFHPSSSADEIMPMLIFTLITMPPEKLNVIGDSNFIQRFRWEDKIEGEAAYCLTNLEAAITFLQTVDLASLRADEAAQFPSKAGTPRSETFPPAFTSVSESSAVAATAETTMGAKQAPAAANLRAALQRRRLSDLIQSPALAIGTASDSFFNTADQGIKTIGSSLNESYRFLLGKLRDSSADGREVVVPRTLDDARKLVGTPPPDDDVSIEALMRDTDESGRPLLVKDDRVLSLVGGKRGARDHSTDSNRSGRSVSSSKKAVVSTEDKDVSINSQTPLSTSSNPALVESMRNLGNSFNPISRLSNMSIRGFGRAATNPSTPVPKDPPSKPLEGADLSAAFPDIAAPLPPRDVRKIDPPKKRFMELQSPSDLKLGEVLDLLRDYRRLASALKEMDAFRE